MITLAAWCVGMAYLTWAGMEKRVWMVWVAVVLPGLYFHSSGWGMALTAVLTAILMLTRRERTEGKISVAQRWALVRFWQEVRVFTSAGLTFWQAVEISADSEPLILNSITAMAKTIAQQPSVTVKNLYWPGEDGDLTLLLLQHGYLHGITEQQIRAQVKHLEGRLRIEDEVRRRRDPLWMTILPAFLLVNVLWIFIVPMISMADQSWFHL